MRIFLAFLICLWAGRASAMMGLMVGDEVSGPDVTAPEVSSATINGTAVVLNFPEAVTRGTNYLDTYWNIDGGTMGNDVGLTYVGGDGTASWSMTAATAAVESEVIDLDFVPGATADIVEDGAGNDLAAVTSLSVTNNTPAAVTYLAEESFDTNPGYDLGASWTEDAAGGTINEDYTTSPAPLEGTESLYVDYSAATVETCYALSADQSRVSWYFMYRSITDITTNGTLHFTMKSSAGTALCSVKIQATNLLVPVAGSTSGTATVSAAANNTTYHLFIDYENSATDTCAIGFSADGTRPTSGNNYSSATTSGFGDVAEVCYTSVTANSEYIIDKMRVDDVQITDNPS